MPEETLNERFGAAEGGPIDCEGQTVHEALELPLADPVNLWLRILSSDPRAGAQSIAVTLRRSGRKRLGVVYEGLTGRSWRFWTDDPERQDPGPIVCVPPTGGTQLLVHNGWLDEGGQPEEWLGNHGIVIEQQGERSWLLHGSRGGGDRPLSFEDLTRRARPCGRRSRYPSTTEASDNHRGPGTGGSVRYMVIETYTQGPSPVYARAAERGRMLPPGLAYLESWIDERGRNRCFQLMETEDPSLFDEWTASWNDLVEFEIVPVISSAEAAARGAG